MELCLQNIQKSTRTLSPQYPEINQNSTRRCVYMSGCLWPIHKSVRLPEFFPQGLNRWQGCVLITGRATLDSRYLAETMPRSGNWATGSRVSR